MCSNIDQLIDQLVDKKHYQIYIINKNYPVGYRCLDYNPDFIQNTAKTIKNDLKNMREKYKGTGTVIEIYQGVEKQYDRKMLIHTEIC